MMQDGPPVVVEERVAEPVSVTGFGIATGSIIDIRETAFTTARLVTEGEVALIGEARRGGAVVRARATSNDPATGGVRLRLTEASWGWRPFRGFSLRIGKAQLSWDTAIVFQPVGFFQRDVNFADLGDFEGRGEGLPLVSVTYGTGAIAATIVASDRLDGMTGTERRPERQIAARLTYDADSLSLALILRQPSTGPFGIGATASATLTDRITGYSSIYANADSVLAAIGGSLATPWNGAISVEYAHDSTGLDRREIAAPHVSPVRGALFRENYLYLQTSLDRDRLALSGGARIGLDDGGVAGLASATWRVAGSAELRLSGVIFAGPRRSEFRQSAARSVVSLTLRRAF